MNICRHCVQENRTCLCPWPADHITALARPSLRISGEPPRSVLLRQHCRVRSFLWKSGVSPHQNCLEDKWASHLVSTEVIYVVRFLVWGRGTWFLWMLWLEAWHLFSGVHWRAVAELTSLTFCIVLSILIKNSWWLTESLWLSFTLFTDSHLFPLCLSRNFYPTLSPYGLIVLASFLILNLSYFISDNKNNKETEEKSPAILPSYYGNYAHFPVFSSNSSPYRYIFYTLYW